MATVTFADDAARRHIQGRKQRRRLVSDVVVGPPPGLARPQRQNGHRAVERLNLTLFIDRQEQRAIGWTQIQPDDIPHLVNEQRVLREFEGLEPVRRQREGLPDAGHGGLAQGALLRQAPRGPMRASRGVDSMVVVKACSTSASVIFRGTPGRGSSSSPSRRRARKRPRHFPTVCFVTWTSRAIAVAVSPAAQRSTKRARKAKAGAVVGGVPNAQGSRTGCRLLCDRVNLEGRLSWRSLALEMAYPPFAESGAPLLLAGCGALAGALMNRAHEGAVFCRGIAWAGIRASNLSTPREGSARRAGVR